MILSKIYLKFTKFLLLRNFIITFFFKFLSFLLKHVTRQDPKILELVW